MKFLKQTRRRYEFGIQNNWDFEYNGIKAKNGILIFQRSDEKQRGYEIFKSIGECEDWYKQKVNQMDFKPNEKQFKTLHDIQFKRVEKITDEEWEKIQAEMVKPDEFTKEDIEIYHPQLAHNFMDRDAERFTPKVLEAFANTLPGKSVLEDHERRDTDKIIGRFYDAYLEKVKIDEVIKRIGKHPNKNIEKHLKEIEEKDGDLIFLIPPFYLLKDNKELVRRINAGILRDMSIGFRADDRKEIKDKDGKTQYWEYVDKGNTEAYEGSFVFLGAQYGAGNRKTADDGGEVILIGEVIKPYANEHACRLENPDKYESFARKNNDRKINGKYVDVIYGILKGKSEQQAIRFPVKNWAASEASKACKKLNGTFEAASKLLDNDKEKFMKVKSKLIGIEKEFEPTEDNVKVLIEEIEEKITERDQKHTEEVEAVQTELDAKNEVLKAFEKDDISEDDIKELLAKATDGNAYKEFLIEEIIKFQTIFETVENEEKAIETEKKYLDRMDVTELKEKLTLLQEKYKKDNPSFGQIPELGKDKDEKQNKSYSSAPTI